MKIDRYRDVVSVSTSRSRDGLKPHQSLVSVSTKNYNVLVSSRLFASRAQDVILHKLVWITVTEYCTDLLSLSKQGVYAWSRLHVIVPYNLILCIIIVIINGRDNKVTTAIIITCRTRPILTSWWRLVTYKRLVSVSDFNVSCPSLDRYSLAAQKISMLIIRWDQTTLHHVQEKVLHLFLNTSLRLPARFFSK